MATCQHDAHERPTHTPHAPNGQRMTLVYVLVVAITNGSDDHTPDHHSSSDAQRASTDTARLSKPPNRVPTTLLDPNPNPNPNPDRSPKPNANQVNPPTSTRGHLARREACVFGWWSSAGVELCAATRSCEARSI